MVDTFNLDNSFLFNIHAKHTLLRHRTRRWHSYLQTACHPVQRGLWSSPPHVQTPQILFQHCWQDHLEGGGWRRIWQVQTCHTLHEHPRRCLRTWGEVRKGGEKRRRREGEVRWEVPESLSPLEERVVTSTKREWEKGERERVRRGCSYSSSFSKSFSVTMLRSNKTFVGAVMMCWEGTTSAAAEGWGRGMPAAAAAAATEMDEVGNSGINAAPGFYIESWVEGGSIVTKLWRERGEEERRRESRRGCVYFCSDTRTLNQHCFISQNNSIQSLDCCVCIIIVRRGSPVWCLKQRRRKRKVEKKQKGEK